MIELTRETRTAVRRGPRTRGISAIQTWPRVFLWTLVENLIKVEYSLQLLVEIFSFLMKLILSFLVKMVDLIKLDIQFFKKSFHLNINQIPRKSCQKKKNNFIFW